MATIVLRPPNFPAGTNVSAWLRSKYPGVPEQVAAQPAGIGAADVGPVAVAADGTLTFTGLTGGARYVAYAAVSGTDTFLAFTCPAGLDPGTEDVEIIGGVVVTSSGLPAGAATAAKQDTEAGKLDTLHTDIVALQGLVDGLEGYTDGIEGGLASILAQLVAGETVDVTDRAGRSLGQITFLSPQHVIIDSATIAALTDGTARIGGTVTVDSELAAAILAADAMALPTSPQVISVPTLYNGATLDRARSMGGVADGAAITGVGAVAFYLQDGSGNVRRVIAASAAGDAGGNNVLPAVLFNGTNWDRLRTPVIFKTATATASGDTAVWTPTSGKKFRLMGYQIQVTNNAATAGGGLVEIVLRDSTTAIGVGSSVFAPAVAATVFGASDDTGDVDLGNGKLSSAANNVLNVNLSAALTAGEVRVVAIGTEE